ncbi:glycosyltransferase family 2 protein [Methylobacterium trifolii]|uniref:glycosyltransferase family 2 protein n=1 Tax=Methylobacterium trifolii TaxID=1003092 RepID=UPI001EDD9F7F|nr:glycosyltransferase family 2 protein [Methylobacterium trifolii]
MREHSATLVAIAKNEARYIVEWLAFHLALGFGRIVVYDNDSSDGTAAILDTIAARDSRVVRVAWPSPSNASPQIAAYTHAVRRVTTPWTMILDIDEFLVPFGYEDLTGLIQSVPEDVASLHVNWLGFGSGGRTDPGYELVTRTFTRCSERAWGNHHHFKTLARTDRITEVLIHDILTSSGRRVLTDFEAFTKGNVGASDRVVYGGVQINHYQAKTLAEFQARMRRGDANYPLGHPSRQRDDSADRFAQLDRNEAEDLKIRAFEAPFEAQYQRLRAILRRA